MNQVLKYNHWIQTVEWKALKSAQAVFNLPATRDLKGLSSDCGQGSCNCGSGCNGECSTGGSCE